MSMRRKDAVIRIGPVSVITLLIIISLATLAVLSWTTAQASQTAAGKQGDALQALYANEVQAQEFLARMDGVLAAQESSGATPEEAAAAVAQAIGGAADGSAVSQTFASGNRNLSVVAMVRDDMTYQIVSWKTTSSADTAEKMELWHGNLE